MSEKRINLTREEQANLEVGATTISRGVAWSIVVLFLLMLIVVPIYQIGYVKKYNATHENQLDQATAILSTGSNAWSTAQKSTAGFPENVLAGNAEMLQSIHKYEDKLEEDAALTHALLGPAQEIFSGVFGIGNEKALIGDDGWLFYRPGLDYLTGPGFLEPRKLEARSNEGNEYTKPPQPDPVKAIIAFRDQLAERGIELIIAPAPTKAMIHPEKYHARYEHKNEVLQNKSYPEFIKRLSEARVNVFDVAQWLNQNKYDTDEEQFLKTDTHWSPHGMEAVAQKLASFINQTMALPQVEAPDYQRISEDIANHGDITTMLKLTEDQKVMAKDEARIHRVTQADGSNWAPDHSADVLLLGDSFCNIYSWEKMGWGASAGFPEQLSYYLKRPMDKMAQNDAGAHASRKLLAKELRSGRDRLAGKKLVIWEFAIRELAVGDWKMIPMEYIAREPKVDSGVLAIESGQAIEVTGVIKERSSVPAPGSVPYKDHICSLHLVDLKSSKDLNGNEALVYGWSMQDNVWTALASMKPGAQVTFRLSSWFDHVGELEAVNRSDLDDSELIYEDPLWGELIK